MMRRTQILLPEDVHRRATEAARARGTSLGALVREALEERLARAGASADPIEELLLADPFDADPHPDPHLSVDVDHHLYGAPRRGKRSRRGRRRGS